MFMWLNWEDLNNRLLNRARREVLGNEWACIGLTRSEMETFHFISGQVATYRNQRVRDLLVEKYRKKLDMKYNRTLGITAISSELTVQDKKHILKAARKAFDQRRKVHRKIIQMAKIAKTADGTMYDFFSFAGQVVNKSGKRTVKGVKNYIKRCIEQDNKCLYSILKPSEILVAAEDILYISKYSESLF
jgi:hypothetical protein